ncbi:MAG: DNA polymerase IV [Candidatus Peribacteraceae bacterium]|nr:DNA polymerase IV [Candidatus Peribacteraceae bacterium]
MIAHIDADSFFVSVLVRKHPKLAGKPVLAAGMGGGCVIAASYEAKEKGVKTGMRISEALKLCPDALQIPSDFRETGLASDQIESIIEEHCPFIEKVSIDEWYLDLRSMIGGVPTDLSTCAENLRLTIQKRTHISVSVGVGPSKLLAKMAGEYRKPGGVTVLTDKPIALEKWGIERETFLRDRVAAAIPGIGRKRVVHTDANEWHTAFDIATADPDTLIRLFGRPGRDIQRELNGEALSLVSVDHGPPKSISRARSFRPTGDRDLLFAHVLRHLEYTSLKMRRQNLSCKGLSMWLRDDKYEYESSNRSLPQQSETEDQLRPFVTSCFQSLYQKNRRYTQAGLNLWNLLPTGTKQYSLFQDPSISEKDERMQQALDTLHTRFGRDAITRGAALKVISGTKRDFDLPIYGD